MRARLFPLTYGRSVSTPAIRLLVSAKIAHQVHSYEHHRSTRSFGAEAVEALAAFDPRRIFKTLVLELSDGRLAVAVLPVPETLSLKSAAAHFAVSKARLADSTRAEKATGYVAGGISPLGQRKRLPTVIDTSALDWDTVLCSAGRRGLEIELSPQNLIRCSGAELCDLTR
ncbi:Cys-tRNA(Pro) deacylase [Skermania sp. ID1734]|uniref:Cys-tRNA(Pro) deacylase n=1 Tax=Skermania sp. ID1734 TaxID=2597516 RepID=UPI00117EACBF|nr:Cys-tRNA(Pro) deacylase [Skermania sp. ID1734]TSD97409.1 Cys-tRNA(Pro) deacylase [Skermania sp. ID1734]